MPCWEMFTIFLKCISNTQMNSMVAEELLNINVAVYYMSPDMTVVPKIKVPQYH